MLVIDLTSGSVVPGVGPGVGLGPGVGITPGSEDALTFSTTIFCDNLFGSLYDKSILVLYNLFIGIVLILSITTSQYLFPDIDFLVIIGGLYNNLPATYSLVKDDNVNDESGTFFSSLINIVNLLPASLNVMSL